MTFEITAAAEHELRTAIEYYNHECPGLGFEFAAEVQCVFDRIANNPRAWVSLSPRSRRCTTRRFPYGILYQIREPGILIVAVMHMHRHPQNWQARL
jgi:plasmid stabilization system protein ParE